MVIKVTEELSWGSPPPGNSAETLDFIMTRVDDKPHDCSRKFNSSRVSFQLNTETINPAVLAAFRRKLDQTALSGAVVSGQKSGRAGNLAEIHSANTEFWQHARACGTSGHLCDAQLYGFSDVGGQTTCHERLGADTDATAPVLIYTGSFK